MKYVPLRRMVIIGVTMSLALSVGTVGAQRISQQAFATELRESGIARYQADGPWKAEVIERELVSPEVYRTVRSSVAVRDAQTYRVDMIEVDESGQKVEWSTVRRGDTVRSITRDGTGATAVHVLENLPPDLSGLLDNALGQRLRDLAESGRGRAITSERVRGRQALKVEVASDHFIWLDHESGLPCKEQYLSGDTVIHETEFLEYESGSLDDALFDLPTPAGATVIREDLGFRQATNGQDHSGALDFVPLPIRAPGSWSRINGGYMDGSTWAEGAPGEPVWIEFFDGADGAVLVSQQRARGAGATISPIDGRDDLAETQVNGVYVYYHENDWMTHAFVELDGVLLSFEAATRHDVLVRFIESIL